MILANSDHVINQVKWRSAVRAKDDCDGHITGGRLASQFQIGLTSQF